VHLNLKPLPLQSCYNSPMLSKSQYTRFLLCPKLLWLSRHDRSRLAPPSPHQQQLSAMGGRVGRTARDLFPGGVEIPYDPQDFPGMVRRTDELIRSGTETIYEASFLYKDVFAAADILHYEQGQWHIYEVKASTGVKDYYLDDGAIQYFILNNSGLKAGSVNIVHINNRYVRGETLDLHSLFTVRDITEQVITRQESIQERIDRMKGILEGEEPKAPIGPHCLSPFTCGARDYCWGELAGIPEQSVFTLARTNQEERFKLYHQGFVRLEDIPLAGRSPQQQRQIRGETFMDREEIDRFLRSLTYPLSHLDFESYQQPVPSFPGTKPFSQIPFQYSLHIETGTGLEHREFLAPQREDPRRLLAEQLIRDIPGEGTILAYNRGFERSIIGSLSGLYPDLAKDLRALAARIEDLMTPFQKGWYYTPAMGGSYSIKKVLPALVPEMEDAYRALPVVHNGGEASALWLSLETEEDEVRIEAVRRGLLAYCRLDTLAMVKILEKLRSS